ISTCSSEKTLRSWVAVPTDDRRFCLDAGSALLPAFFFSILTEPSRYSAAPTAVPESRRAVFEVSTNGPIAKSVLDIAAPCRELMKPKPAFARSVRIAHCRRSRPHPQIKGYLDDKALAFADGEHRSLRCRRNRNSHCCQQSCCAAKIGRGTTRIRAPRAGAAR